MNEDMLRIQIAWAELKAQVLAALEPAFLTVIRLLNRVVK